MSELSRIKLKVERAKEHIRDLERAIQAFRESDPYGYRIEDDLRTGDKVHRLWIKKETPDCFALLIGDAVHNLRAALDHLVWQLVIAHGQIPKSGPGGTQFRIYSTSPKATSRQGLIQGVSPAAQDLIDRAKPYKGGNDDLWVLEELDVTDKHKLLIVTAFALSEIMPIWKGSGGWLAMRADITSLTPKDGIVDMRLTVTGPHPQDFSIHVPVGKQLDGTLPVLLDGTTVARILAPVHEEAKFDLAFQIAFREPELVRGKEVVGLLTHLANVVESFIDQFGVAQILT